MPSSRETPAIVVERYKYILQQLHALNENVYRFFTIFQTLVTAIATVALTLFAGYSGWNIDPASARAGVRGLLILATITAAFTVILVVSGLFSWLDYRREECEITSEYLNSNFREAPKLKNFYRWYETYIVVFIVAITVFLWIVGDSLIISKIN